MFHDALVPFAEMRIIKMKPTLATLEGVDLSAITEAEEKINKGHKEKIALVAYVTL